jgi:hypothetical protein
MHLTQRATSYCLYKHRSQPIDVSNNQNQYILLFTLVFYFCFFSSIRSSRHDFNLLGCYGLRIFFVHTLLGRRRGTMSKPSSAPDYRRSRQNRTIRFVKLDSSVSAVSSKILRLMFDSCGNTFWQLRWGIDYFTCIKHEGRKLRHQRIRS